MFEGYLLFLTTIPLAMVFPAVLGQEASVVSQDTVLFGCHGEYDKMLSQMGKLEVQMGKLLNITEKYDLKMEDLNLRMTNLDLKVNSIERKQIQSEDRYSATMEGSIKRDKSKQESKDENSEELKRMHDTLLVLNETASMVEKSLYYFQTSVSGMLSPLKSVQQTQGAKDDELTEKWNMTVVNEAARLYVANSQDKSIWRKVFAHDTSGGFFANLEEAKNKNPDNENADLFSILDQLELFRDTDGNFQFKVCYPEVTYTPINPCNEWIQSSNPLHETPITGFKPLKLAFHKTSRGDTFGGLSPSSDSSTLIDETPSHSDWYFAIGALTNWHKKNTIPGPHRGSSSDLAAIKKVEMFVKMTKK